MLLLVESGTRFHTIEVCMRMHHLISYNQSIHPHTPSSLPRLESYLYHPLSLTFAFGLLPPTPANLTPQSMPEKADTPSNFTLKLRKHLRTRRLEAISQLGVDRIVRLTFGSGEATMHVILEFYAQGNLILADPKYEVLTLLRSHRDDAKGFAIMARHTYPIHTIRLRQAFPYDALAAAVQGGPGAATPERAGEAAEGAGSLKGRWGRGGSLWLGVCGP